MAKYANGTNYGKSIDPSAENILDQGLYTGKVRVMQDYAAIGVATTLKSTDYIQLGGKLPTGATVIGVFLANGAVGTGTDSYLCVGDEGDSTRYIGLSQSTTAGIYLGPDSALNMNYVITGVTDNYIRVMGSASADCINSAGSVEVSVLYVME